uniref:Cytochrome c oxidase subunit 3 n=1 Tax=Acrobeloides varius TaxID=2020968 RepID=A0A6M4B2F1_9BILA|nr:cytochrome c oxidase subunit III [Acrobeloides varius]
MKSNFYMVGRTHYPWWISSQVASLATSLVIYLKYGLLFGVFFSLFVLVLTVYVWTKNVVLEGMSGYHSYQLMESFKFSFLLFIFSEVMFFASIFWAFFDAALSPSVEVGEEWSPLGINPVNPYGIPLFNTVVLLSSGATLTWSHNTLLSNEKSSSKISLFLTLILAFMFESAQYVEFKEATFSMSDGVYGSIFYFGTGFHGLHVIFGHLFLTYNFFRLAWGHFSRFQHLSFEFAIVYWHFVDVVWIFLYTFMYWWSF